MSRSRKKTPICGITAARSDSEWKAKAARILRHRVKQTLAKEMSADEFAGKRWDAVNPWSAPKDGKSWFGESYPTCRRK